MLMIPAATAAKAIIGARPRVVPVVVNKLSEALAIGLYAVVFLPNAVAKLISCDLEVDPAIIGNTIAIAIAEIIKIRIAARMKSTPIMADLSLLNFIS
jgi:hypothetical protein